jgi:hypothetical protein
VSSPLIEISADSPNEDASGHAKGRRQLLDQKLMLQTPQHHKTMQEIHPASPLAFHRKPLPGLIFPTSDKKTKRKHRRLIVARPKHCIQSLEREARINKSIERVFEGTKREGE